VTPTEQPTPTPTPTPVYEFYTATLFDCCTGYGYESVKIKVDNGTLITVGKIVNLDLNNGYGMSCFEITTISEPGPPSASTTVSVYGDCATCQTQNNVICPEIHRLDPCGSIVGPLAYAIYLPNSVSQGSVIIGYTGSPSNQICFEVGGVVIFTPNVFFISEHSGDCISCLPTPPPTPTQTVTPSSSGAVPG